MINLYCSVSVWLHWSITGCFTIIQIRQLVGAYTISISLSQLHKDAIFIVTFESFCRSCHKFVKLWEDSGSNPHHTKDKTKRWNSLLLCVALHIKRKSLAQSKSSPCILMWCSKKRWYISTGRPVNAHCTLIPRWSTGNWIYFNTSFSLVSKDSGKKEQ